MDWIPVASLMLNLLLIPIWRYAIDIRIKVTRLETTVCAQGTRLTNLEDRVNRHMDNRAQTA